VLDIGDFSAIRLRNARIIDPFADVDACGDVTVVNGIIAAETPAYVINLNATGLIVCPGLLDMHVHLREPGHEHKETIATGCAAAAAGGFTRVACMPNTNPPLDEPERIRFVIERSNKENLCEVLPVAAISRGRHGIALTNFEALQLAGAVAFTDDGTGVEDDALMRAAFERSKALGSVLIQHCEYRSLSAGGVMHLGQVSRRLELPGLDPRSEEVMIERDLTLCRELGAAYHVAHISTAKAVGMVRNARRAGLPVTAEVTPHHLLLTDEVCATSDPSTKMHPPLRTSEDVESCRMGLIDGTIDAIATDHAPHAAEEKALGFLKAPPGLVGLETCVGLSARAMIESGLSDWPRLIAWLSRGPATVLRQPPWPIRKQGMANLTVIDPAEKWTVQPELFLSKSRNTPFAGWKLTGRAVGTIRGSRCCFHQHLSDRME